MHSPEEEQEEQPAAKTVYQAAGGNRDIRRTSPRCRRVIQDAGEPEAVGDDDVSETDEATVRGPAVDASAWNDGGMVVSENFRRQLDVYLKCGVARPSRTASVHQSTIDGPRDRLSHKGRSRGFR